TLSACNRDAAVTGLSLCNVRGPDRRPGRAPARASAGRQEASEHVPEVRLALPRRRARAGALGVRPLRAPLPDARAGAYRLVRRSRFVLGGRDRRALRRPAALLRSAAVRGA